MTSTLSRVSTCGNSWRVFPEQEVEAKTCRSAYHLCSFATIASVHVVQLPETYLHSRDAADERVREVGSGGPAGGADADPATATAARGVFQVGCRAPGA